MSTVNSFARMYSQLGQRVLGLPLVVLVAMGSALGAVARLVLWHGGNLTISWVHFSGSTSHVVQLAVLAATNFVGCVLIGWHCHAHASHHRYAQRKALIETGILGGFTSLSAFWAVHMSALAELSWIEVGLAAVASCGLCILGNFVGARSARGAR